MKVTNKKLVNACQSILQRINKTHLQPGEMLLLSYIRWAKDPSRPPTQTDVPKCLLDEVFWKTSLKIHR